MDLLELKKHITHFSAEVKKKGIQEQEVIVGGIIKSIVPPIGEEFPMYILILDDYVDQLHVFVSPDLKTSSKEVQIGNYVSIKGLVNVFTRSIKKEIKKEVSIFAYSIKGISSNTKD